MKNRLMLLGVVAVLALGLTAPAFGGSNVVSSSAAAAKSTASKALKKATKANKKAKAAQATADAAGAAAANAQSAADAAQSTADGAQSTANAAQSAASAAQATANSKYGSVVWQDETATASNQSDKAQVSACPTGKRSVGGGYVLTGGTNAAYVNINEPYGNTAWIVSAQDDAGVNSNWSLAVAVNCIGS